MVGVRVAIGSLKLGDGVGSYKIGESNPQSIEYSMDFNIVEHDCVRKKKTQCTQPKGLWVIDITVTTVTPESKSFLTEIDAGPHWVQTDLIGLPMYLRRKKAIQEPGDPDVYRWQLSFIEAYDGVKYAQES